MGDVYLWGRRLSVSSSFTSLPEPVGLFTSQRGWIRISVEDAHTAGYRVKELAAMSGLTPRQLERLFLAKIGVTPHVWLTQCRQVRALALLATGKSVKEVSCELDYSHQSHFSRAFCQFHGSPPSNLRPPASAHVAFW